MSHRLIPAPDALANLIQQLADAIPIDGDADRDALFATCGLHPDGSVPHEYGGDSAIFALRCDLSETVSASWTRFQDEFLGVMLFVYSSPDPGSKTAQAGYRKLHRHLRKALGAPQPVPGFEDTPVTVWRTGGVSVTVQLFDRRDSTVMISITDPAVEARSEAAARARAKHSG
ncbi:hypothetical protein [Herbiconiux sp. A18JL235]|uniref:MmyB-like transcription regulator ligand binding domain-containing protein n=1 Tax=Herbiconiux sp. A18JL235 TaxID=3152363 RepID=A0AB39BMZ1_9MICO